ncbi:ATP-dependent DNA/RNA helicase DHX36 isoform X1 [Rhipicephalus microplus]|uniref:ATP-dependent DNA/RNA helicase DHX36 isoform X1 n=2 Tax=Rhipicephalus microplus TaxID=6941 RepID=UPI003F6A99C0
MNFTVARLVRLRSCAMRSVQVGSRHCSRGPRILRKESTALSSGDALSSTGDVELQQGDNTDTMDPTNTLASLDHLMAKHCGSGHCLSICKVVLDGQQQWKAEVSVKWPRKLSVDAITSSKETAISMASARMCTLLQKMGVLEAIKQGPALEAAGEPCPFTTSSQGTSLDPNAAQNGTPLAPQTKDMVGLPKHNGTPTPYPPAQLRGAQSQEVAIRPQEVARRNSTAASQRLKSWTQKRELGRCKSILHNIYAHVSKLKDDSSLIPVYDSNVYQDGVAHWTSKVVVKWPRELVYEGSGRNKSEAEALAARALIQYLVVKGHVDSDLSPKTASDQEVKRRKRQRTAPVAVALPVASVHEMENLLKEFEALVASAPRLRNDDPEDEEACMDTSLNAAEGGENKKIRDIMTGRLLRSPDEHYIRRDRELLTKAEKSWLYKTSYNYQRARTELPIYPYRDEILSAVNRKRVVVICGETGSGKTTQVPQFIFENWVREGIGSRCNIVITQPRRFAAVSMAKRVATERREELSDTVGYQVRFSKQLLSLRGGMLFCTVGILLRHLQHNSNLLGVSHVIVDEVHERDVRTDFLLALLRELLFTNATLKVILMSATINAEKFSEYFEDAPIIRIPGRTHPVNQFFLEDIIAENIVTKAALEKSRDDPIKIVPDVLTYLMEMKPPGAILCFLPGWNEINNVRAELCRRAPARFHEWILPLHSRLHYQEQQKIFASPPPDVRKVILSTNIAETSITVEDVTYVVDTGLHREQRFNPSTGVSLLGTFPTSRASVRQRAGRAGRVRPGESYHLFMRDALCTRDEFQLPEILTIDLTRVVLDAKLYCPHLCAEDVLSLVPDPPSSEMMTKAIKDLQDMGLMNDSAELTDLGHHVCQFATTPQLAKAVIYGALLGCLDSVVSTVSLLAEASNLFAIRRTAEGASRTKDIKRCYDAEAASDHIALWQIFSHWRDFVPGAERQSFCQRNELSFNGLDIGEGMVDDLVNTLKGVMAYTDALSQAPAQKHWGLNLNSRRDDRQLVLAALTAGLYPNVLRILQGKIKNNQIMREGVEFACLDQKLAAISEESLLHRVPPVYEHPWLIYYSALQPSKYQRTTVYDCSMVTSLHVLLFAGLGTHKKEGYLFDSHAKAPRGSDQGCLVVDEQPLLVFRCSERDADLIWRWRRMIDYVIDLHISMEQWEENGPEETYLRCEMWPRIVNATSSLLSHSSSRGV